MNTFSERSLREVMHDLADGPAPADPADRALSRAHRVHRARLAGVAGAAAVAVVLAAPLAAQALHRGTGARGGQPGVSATPSATCVVLPVVPTGPVDPPRSTNVKPLSPADWPDFVRATVDALPPRSDYVLGGGYSGCLPGRTLPASPAVPDSTALIMLGDRGQHGWVRVSLYRHFDSWYVDATCDQISGLLAGAQILSCRAGTGGAPTAVAYVAGSEAKALAVYPDGRAVAMDAISDDGIAAPPVGAEELRVVAADPAVIAGLPAASAPWTSSSGGTPGPQVSASG